MNRLGKRGSCFISTSVSVGIVGPEVPSASPARWRRCSFPHHITPPCRCAGEQVDEREGPLLERNLQLLGLLVRIFLGRRQCRVGGQCCLEPLERRWNI